MSRSRKAVIANLRVNIPVLERQMLQQKESSSRLLLGRTPESITDQRRPGCSALALPR